MKKILLIITILISIGASAQIDTLKSYRFPAQYPSYRMKSLYLDSLLRIYAPYRIIDTTNRKMLVIDVTTGHVYQSNYIGGGGSSNWTLDASNNIYNNNSSGRVIISTSRDYPAGGQRAKNLFIADSLNPALNVPSGIHIQNRWAGGKSGITGGSNTTDAQDWSIIYTGASTYTLDITSNLNVTLNSGYNGNLYFKAPSVSGSTMADFSGVTGVFHSLFGMRVDSTKYINLGAVTGNTGRGIWDSLGFLKIKDAGGSWARPLTSVFKRNDSVFYKNGLTEVFAFKDSSGSGSTPTLDQVVVAGGTTSHTVTVSSGSNSVAIQPTSFDVSDGTNSFHSGATAAWVTDGSNSVNIRSDHIKFVGNGNSDAMRLYGILPASGIDSLYLPDNTGKDTLATKADIRTAIDGLDTSFFKATITTASTTATAIYTIPTISNEMSVLEVTLTGMKADGSGGITGKKIVRWKNLSGTVTLGSITSILSDEVDAAASGASWTITTSGTNVIIQVTPIASSFTWNCAGMITTTPMPL